MEHVMRQTLISLRMAERLGLDEADRTVVYYSGLLAWVGCHSDAYEQAKWFGDDVRQSLVESYERWDGKGPIGLCRDNILLTARLVQLSDVAAAFHAEGGAAAAEKVVRDRSGTQLDPSRRMADLAFEAATTLGLADAVTIRRAGLVHDLGRLGVPNSIWDKDGPLTVGENEQVRLHPTLTERMLAFSPGLSRLGALAIQHHERLDGSGYPRGLAGKAIRPASRR
jgi:HD-GYP domain-containing protein (c-di-GMP phosphodiesterase class II)